MPYDVGTARGVIEFDYDGTGVDKAVADQSRLEKSTGRSSAAVDSIGRNAGRAGLVIAGGLAAGVAAAANFQQRLSAIQAVSGATESQMGKLSDKALQLGADTAFSAGESATAMEELIKAGLSVDDVLNGAADATVNLAAAGQIDLPQAATIAANAMNQFNLSAKDMVGVADNIAGAANASAIDVSEFGQSLQQVGAVANLAGVDFKDTATAIALMGNAGIKGSDAGTSLKSMFARLQPTTKKQADEMKRLGLITKDGQNAFYDMEGNLRSLDEVSGILQHSTEGLTKQQKQAALQTLFGSDAIRAAAILSNAGAKGFNNMAKSMDKVKAADVAKTRMDNLKGSVEQMLGSLETLGITLGSILLPSLRRVVDALTQMLNWITNLSSGMQKAIVVGLAFAAAGLIIFSAIIKISRAVIIINTAMELLRGTMIATWLAALGPIALIVAALAIVAAAIYLLYTRSETFRNAVTAAFNAVKNAIINNVLPSLQGIIGAFQALIAAVLPIIMQIVGVFKSELPDIIATAKSVFANIKSIIQSTMSIIMSIVKVAWAIIKAVFKVALAALTNIIKNGAAVITAIWRTIGPQLLNIIRAVMQGILGVVRGAFNILAGIFKLVASVLKGDWSGAWDAIKQIVKGAWQIIVAIVKTGWELVKNAFIAGVKLAVAVVKGLGGKIEGALSALGGAMYNAAAALIQNLVNGIQDKIGAAVDAVKAGLDKIKGLLPGSPIKWGPLKSWNDGSPGRKLMELLAMGVEKGASKAQFAIAKVLSDLFDGLPRDVGPLEQDTAQDIGELMTRIEDEYASQAKAAEKRIHARFAKQRKRLEKALKAAEDTKTKVDDKRAQKALDDLDKKEKSVIDRSVARYKNLTQQAKRAVADVTGALIENAKQHDEVNAKLETARDNLQALEDQAADFASGVEDSFRKYGEVVGLGVREAGEQAIVTSETLLTDLRARVEKAKHFAALIAQLAAAGLSQAGIQELIAAGIDGGMATAEAIAAGGVGAINEVNALQQTLTDLGAQLGSDLAGTYYGVGIATAQSIVDGLVIDENNLATTAANLRGKLETILGGETKEAGHHAGRQAVNGLVEGLTDNEGKLNRAGKQVARTLVDAFRDELGIHSPSRVTYKMGELVGQGFANGIAAMAGEVAKASGDLTAAMIAAAGTPTIQAAFQAQGSTLAAGLSTPSGGGVSGLGSSGNTFTAGNPQSLVDVRVYIGDAELTDIVRSEISQGLAPLRQLSRQGGI